MPATAHKEDAVKKATNQLFLQPGHRTSAQDAAAMGEELKAWVADALHAVAGFSSSTAAAYVASLPARASSRDQLAALLGEPFDGGFQRLWAILALGSGPIEVDPSLVPLALLESNGVLRSRQLTEPSSSQPANHCAKAVPCASGARSPRA